MLFWNALSLLFLPKLAWWARRPAEVVDRLVEVVSVFVFDLQSTRILDNVSCVVYDGFM